MEVLQGFFAVVLVLAIALLFVVVAGGLSAAAVEAFEVGWDAVRGL